MSFVTCEIKGIDQVKEMVKSFGYEMNADNVRQIMTEAGKVVADEARRETPYTGLIGLYYRQDIGVYRDRRRSAKNAEYVLVGPRFKNYAIQGRDQKVALIAQHMTRGFRQTERKTRQGERRGRVRDQVMNPVLSALNATQGTRNAAINKGIYKTLNKIRRKYNRVLV